MGGVRGGVRQLRPGFFCGRTTQLAMHDVFDSDFFFLFVCACIAEKIWPPTYCCKENRGVFFHQISILSKPKREHAIFFGRGGDVCCISALLCLCRICSASHYVVCSHAIDDLPVRVLRLRRPWTRHTNSMLQRQSPVRVSPGLQRRLLELHHCGNACLRGYCAQQRSRQLYGREQHDSM
jgi:hypothetical protein